MDEKKWAIPIPSDKEIDKQITLIIKQGLPKKQNFYQSLIEMWHHLGWRYIGLNRYEIVFCVLLMMVVFGYVLYVKEDFASTFYGLLFMISPILFLGLSAFTFYERCSNNTFELEMTMKYTVFQLMTFRMLFFSCLTIVVNMSLILLLSLSVEIDVIRAILLSLTGLFLFSAGLLFVLHSGSFLKRGIVFVGLWIVVNVLLIMNVESHYINVLERLPIIVYAIIVMCCLSLYVHSLKYMFYRRQEEAL
ncbi:hypothetical protein [Bacillus sp. JJ722]|uniref:hypothetical protein n=1 Tax=Bacillus sp. JJ722 TaxID=3122973 RepID=UPI0030004802